MFMYMELTWSQETEEVQDTCVSFFGAALGIGGQEAKEQYWIYLMRILDFQYLFFFYILIALQKVISKNTSVC